MEETLYQRLAPYASALLGLFMLIPRPESNCRNYGCIAATIISFINIIGILLIIWSVFEFSSRKRKITLQRQLKEKNDSDP